MLEIHRQTNEEAQPGLFDDKVQSKFDEFHEANPHVFAMWEKLTFEAINRGYKNIGAALIRELIRWETGLITTGNKYKMPNVFTPYYARLFMKKHPQHKGFFRTASSVADAEI